ncbi:MAG: hypothetical protein QXS47_06305 [Thermoplasmata archaeon]
MSEFVTIPQEEFIKEVINLVENAQKEGIILRILGALAIHIHSTHCTECIILHKSLDRLGGGKPMFTDLDLMAYSKQSKQVRKFFEKRWDINLINMLIQYLAIEEIYFIIQRTIFT